MEFGLFEVNSTVDHIHEALFSFLFFPLRFLILKDSFHLRSSLLTFLLKDFLVHCDALGFGWVFFLLGNGLVLTLVNAFASD